MKEEVKEVLLLLESRGFEAYIVGGFVRDFYLGIINNDYDICTNAKPKDIKNLFYVIEEKLGSIKIKHREYRFVITTYRKEMKYKNRIPQIKFTNYLKEDLLRRDFTINAICMNKDEKYIDICNGISDIENKIIRIIGDNDTKIKEDPLRILRAIRFATILDFDIEPGLNNAIMKYNYLVKELTYYRKKSELDKMFLSANINKCFELLKKYSLYEYLEIDINDYKYINNKSAVWAGINYSPKYVFTNKEMKDIRLIKRLLELDKITVLEIYYYGMDYCKIVAEMKKVNIDSLINDLIIINRKDIAITIDDIRKNTTNNISTVYKLLEIAILEKRIPNERENIINFIKNI